MGFVREAWAAVAAAAGEVRDRGLTSCREVPVIISRIAGSPDRRIAGSPDRRIAGSPDRRIAGSPDRRIAPPARLPVMIGSAWRRLLRPSSPPETSAPAGRGLRRGLLPALLCLPLLAGLAAPAAAQTTPSIAVAVATSPTEGNPAEFALSATSSGSWSSSLTVTVNVAQTGNYVAANHLGNRDITIPAGQFYASTTFSIPTIGDNTDQAEGSITVTVQSGTGYTVTGGTATASVVDDDPVEVSLTGGGRIRDGNTGDSVNIEISVPRPVDGELISVPLVMTSGTGAQLPGSTSPDFSYAVTGGTVTAQAGTATPVLRFGTGSSRMTLTLTPTAGEDSDSADETITVGFGTFTQSVQGVGGGAKAHPANNSATVRISEPRTISFTGVATSVSGPLDPASTDGTHSVSESVGALWVELALSQAPEYTTTVYVREKKSGTTATHRQDYKRSGTGFGWIANFGGGSRKARFRVPIVADGIADDKETLTLEIYNVSSIEPNFSLGHTIDAAGTYTLTIRDYTATNASDYVDVWLSKDEYEVTEGEALEATVHLQHPRDADTTINLTETRGTATDGTDYTAGPYSVTVPAGRTSATFTVQTTQDEEQELGDETFRVRIDDSSLPAGFATSDGTGRPEEAVVEIVDDEYTFCFGANSYLAPEGEEGVLPLTFSRPLPQAGSFRFRYLNLNASDSDYTRVFDFPVFFDLPAGTEEYTLRLPVAADLLYEDNELLKITSITPTIPNGILECSTDIIIKDRSREVDFQAAAYTAHEGREAEVGIRVVERGTDDLMTLRKPVTLHIAATGTGSATAGTDYAAGPWTLTIPAGASRGVLRIPVHADGANDDGETIDLEIKRATGGSGVAPGRQLGDQNGNVLSANLHVRVRDTTDMPNGAATVTIQGASGAPSGTRLVWIEAGPQVSEGSDATFTLKADPAPLAPLDVSIHVGDTGTSQTRHLAEEHRGLRTATVDTTGSTVFTVPTQTNGSQHTSAIRVALMDPSLLFASQEADYMPGKPSVAYVGVDAAVPKFKAQRDALSAVAEAPSAPVSNLRVTAVDATSAQATWDAVPHATAYRLEWEGGSEGDYIGGGSNGITGTSATIHHNAPAAMTLTVRVVPWHVDDYGQVQMHDGLAATATLAVGPADPLAAARNACVPASVRSDVEGYAGETHYGAAHVKRWNRALAAFGVDTGETAMTGDEARDMMDKYTAKRWRPIVEAIECIEEAEKAAQAASLPEIAISGGGDVTEGASASFTVTATPAPSSPLAVTLTVGQSGDFAASGQTGTRQVTVPTGGSVTVQVATVDDAVLEADGSVSATVAAGTGYNVAAAPADTASVAVADDDTPVVSIAAGNGVTEGSPASFTVTASPAPSSPLAVKLTVGQSGDYAAAGETGAREVTVPTGGSATVQVATADDSADEPDGSVSVTVGAGTGYAVAASPGDTASVAVADDDAAPPVSELTIGDVTANESDRLMWFTVTLSPASDRAVSVDYRTRESNPVSARKHDDFLQIDFGDVTFSPGETSKRFWVYMFDDGHDEGSETFEVALSHPTGGARIADGVAVGTIVNSDPMPAAWLARFGRTAAEQALDGIAGRIAAPREAGARGTIAGQALSFDPGSGSPGSQSGAANDNAAIAGVEGAGPLALSGLDTPAARFGAGGFGHDAHGFGQGFAQSRTMTGLEALLGSSFTATGETDATGGSLAFWGRAAQSSFDGREGTFSLDGETTTAMLGADYARGKWLVGLALMQSSGEGGYADAGTGSVRCPQDLDAETREVLCGGAVREGDGDVEASLTAAVPYAAIQASERLRLWGVAGYGTGEVTLKPSVGGSLSSDISWTMAAAGARSDLLVPPKEGSGPTLALTADALWARTSSEKTHELAASDSDVTRLRVGLEGGYAIATEGGGRIVPRVEIGARHDGGDAETGFGVELGGGIAWTDPAIGLSLDLSGRTLIAHGNDDLEDQGFAASLAFDPNPGTERGLSLTLSQDWGGSAKGGLDALFATDPLADRAGTAEATSRWQAEAAYGLPAFSGRFTGSPHVGLGLATGERDYTLGWRLSPAANANTPDLSFGVKATRRESEGVEPEHTVGLELRANW